MDDQFVAVSTPDKKLETLANKVTNSMWYALTIGIGIGCCFCGMIQHVNENPQLYDIFGFVFHSSPWWIWLLPMTVLCVLFWYIEKRYKDNIGV